jgi:hypothetical protein
MMISRMLLSGSICVVKISAHEVHSVAVKDP